LPVIAWLRIRRAGHYAALSLTANEGIATSGSTTPYRGVGTIPLELRVQGWNHVGGLDVHADYVLDDYQGPDGATSKLGSQLLVEVTPPAPGNVGVTTVQRYTLG
jgi:hypothetical protein